MKIEMIVAPLVMTGFVIFALAKLPQEMKIIEDKSFPVFTKFVEDYENNIEVDCDILVYSKDTYSYRFLENDFPYENTSDVDILDYERIMKKKIPFCRQEIAEYEFEQKCNSDLIHGSIDNFVLTDDSDEAKIANLSENLMYNDSIMDCRRFIYNEMKNIKYSIIKKKDIIELPEANILVKKEMIKWVEKKTHNFIDEPYYIVNVGLDGKNINLFYGKEEDANNAVKTLNASIK